MYFLKDIGLPVPYSVRWESTICAGCGAGWLCVGQAGSNGKALNIQVKTNIVLANWVRNCGVHVSRWETPALIKQAPIPMRCVCSYVLLFDCVVLGMKGYTLAIRPQLAGWLAVWS